MFKKSSEGVPSGDLGAILQAQQATLAEQTQILASLKNLVAEQNKTLQEQGRMLEVLGKGVLRDVLADVDATIQDRTMSMMETMARVKDGASLARWGDGEIRLMLQPEFELSFQRPNPELAQRLQSLLANYDALYPSTLLAFPTTFVSRLWMGIWAESWHQLGPLLRQSSAPWANTHVSRPLFFQKHGQDAVKAWREVWAGKKVCVIAGKGSRFELLPELFDSAASIHRVDSLPRDAFGELDALTERINAAPEADIYLCALGPTGTVLAAHLASEAGGSRHAVDVGHLASSYANVFLGGKFPEQVAVVKK